MKRTLAWLLLGLPLVLAALPARADDSKRECLSAYENAQLLRRKGELRGARDAARICSRSGCPAALQGDCTDWYTELDRTIPSVVFEVKSEHGDELDVRVSIDGTLVTSHLDGKAVEADPGAHTLTFEMAGKPPIEKKILLKAGERNRSVAVSFGTPAKEATAQVVPAGPRPVPAIVYVLGGVGVAGAASFVTFALLGNGEKSSVKSQCAPFCSDDELAPIQTRYLVADISLGVGVVSLGAAAYFYFTRPTVPAATHPPTVGFDVAPTRGGGVLQLHRTF